MSNNNIDLFKLFLDKTPLDPQINLLEFNIKNLYKYYNERCKNLYLSLTIRNFDISDLDYDINNDYILTKLSENDVFKIENNYVFIKLYMLYKDIINMLCDNKKLKLRTYNYFDKPLLEILNAVKHNNSKDYFIRLYLKFFKNLENNNLENYLYIILSSNDFRSKCLKFLQENDINIYNKMIEYIDNDTINNNYDYLFFLKNVEFKYFKNNIEKLNDLNCNIFIDLYINLIDDEINIILSDNLINKINDYYNDQSEELEDEIKQIMRNDLRNVNTKYILKYYYLIFLKLLNLPKIISLNIKTIHENNIFKILVYLSQFVDLQNIEANKDSALIFTTIILRFYIYYNSIIDSINDDYNELYKKYSDLYGVRKVRDLLKLQEIVIESENILFRNYMDNPENNENIDENIENDDENIDENIENDDENIDENIENDDENIDENIENDDENIDEGAYEDDDEYDEYNENNENISNDMFKVYNNETNKSLLKRRLNITRLYFLKDKNIDGIFYTNYFMKLLSIDIFKNFIEDKYIKLSIKDIFELNDENDDINNLNVFSLDYLALPFFNNNNKILNYLNNIEINLLKLNKILYSYKKYSKNYQFLLNQIFFGDDFAIISKDKENITNNIYLFLIKSKTESIEI